MPIVHITVTKPLTVEVKSDLMEYVAQQICSNTTRTMIPDRTEPVKKVIMKALHDKLAEIEPDLQDEIVIIFNDIPLSCAMLGGETRSDNPDK